MLSSTESDLAKLQDVAKSDKLYYLPNQERVDLLKRLAGHYGFTFSEEDVKYGIGEIGKNIKAVLKLEEMEIDPFKAIAEFRSIDWNAQLSPYNKYEFQKPHSIDFHVFVEACNASLVYQYANELTEWADLEKVRLLNMDPGIFFNKIAKGMLLSQRSYPEDLHSQWTRQIAQIRSKANTDGLFFVSKDKMDDLLRNIFSSLTTTAAIKDKVYPITIKLDYL